MKSNKLAMILFSVIFLLVGIGAFIGFFLFSNSNKEFEKHAEQIKGVVYNIDSYTTGTGKHKTRHHDVTVSYEYEGTSYITEVNFYSSSMYVGKEIDLLVDVNNPNHVKVAEENTVLKLIFLILGSAFTLSGVLVAFMMNRISNRGAKLIKEGQQIQAKIDNIYCENNIIINGVHPFKVVCSAMVRGEMITFKSKNIFFDPNMYYCIGGSVDVYIDPMNPQKYHVDVKERPMSASLNNPGYQGNQGFQNNQGYQGNQGFQNNQGYQGNQGFQNNQGYQGNQGFQNNQGYQGNQGFQNNQGNQGF